MHQHATGARKILGEQAIGVSRGGKNNKIHALINENFQLIGLLLSGGYIHDSECAIELLSKVNFDGVLADKAYACDKIRDCLEERGAVVCIPDKSNFKVKHNFDADCYKQRNFVERFF